ncbi:MAG: sugar transferase [Bacteroidales bacterium]|nr:sugar transferase [Bacteroidales bacterium]
MKRLIDIFLALSGILILLPFFFVISLLIVASSGGGAFYAQQRVGKNQRIFRLLKFRTMYKGSDRKGLLTIGGNDPRITPVGRWLRKYKLDELPQLWNILKGEMSFVGPRPEVEKYVRLYNEKQLKVLTVRPGLTDYASLAYSDESILLKKYDNPEEVYIQQIMPDKLEMNLRYIENMNPGNDLIILLKTLVKIFG